MGCPRKTYLDDYVTFGICTHDPNTGVLTDADSLPVYRIYEDEVAFPVLTGTMCKLDDANTAGFYTDSVHCSRQHGFDIGNTYTIYIEATVDGDTGGMCYGFNIKPGVRVGAVMHGINIIDKKYHIIYGSLKAL